MPSRISGTSRRERNACSGDTLPFNMMTLHHIPSVEKHGPVSDQSEHISPIRARLGKKWKVKESFLP